MGTWGPGILENDHALDLLSAEATRWVGALRRLLELPDLSWDDVEGPLIYVQLLADCRVQVALVSVDGLPELLGRSSREVVSGWKQTYLEAFDRARSERASSPRYLQARRAVIVRVFNALIAHSPNDDARPEPPRRIRRKRSGPTA